MTAYSFDLHIHSCLSPCADNDMTPANIAGMATLAGLQIVALTDHNSCKNCPAFYEAALSQGLIPVAGMELTTAEDIHMVCLFEALPDAMAFDEYVNSRRVLISNRPDIFGDQLIMDAADNVIGTDSYLLSNATEIPVDEVYALVKSFGGICYPAHIDKQANSYLSTLGSIPETAPYLNFELHDIKRGAELTSAQPALLGKRLFSSSDAHFLWDIRDASESFELPDEPYSRAAVRHELFRLLSTPL